MTARSKHIMNEIIQLSKQYNNGVITMSTVYKLNAPIQGHPEDCIRVDLCGETSYVSRRFYEAWVLEMSTGDFHVHQTRIAYVGETNEVADFIAGDPNESDNELYEAEFYRFREAPQLTNLVYLNQYKLKKGKGK